MLSRRLIAATLAVAAGCRSSIGEPPYTPSPPFELPPGPSLTPDRFETDTTVGPLHYHLEQKTTRGWVEVSVTATNLSADMLHLRYGACLVSIRLHVFRDYSDVGLLDPTQGPFVCQAYLTLKDLAPNESIPAEDLGAVVSVSRIAGTSLSSGQYYLRVVTGRLDRNPGIWPTGLLIPAGAITFAR